MDAMSETPELPAGQKQFNVVLSYGTIAYSPEDALHMAFHAFSTMSGGFVEVHDVHEVVKSGELGDLAEEIGWEPEEGDVDPLYAKAYAQRSGYDVRPSDPCSFRFYSPAGEASEPEFVTEDEAWVAAYEDAPDQVTLTEEVHETVIAENTAGVDPELSARAHG